MPLVTVSQPLWVTSALDLPPAPTFVLQITSPESAGLDVLTIFTRVATVGLGVLSETGTTRMFLSVQPLGVLDVFGGPFNSVGAYSAAGFWAPGAGGPSIQNFGRISVHSDGPAVGVLSSAQGRYLLNEGQIDVLGPTADGVVFDGDVSVTNDGTISATSTSAAGTATAVALHGVHGALLNTGAILAVDPTPGLQPGAPQSIAVLFSAAESPANDDLVFDNSGLIQGDIALQVAPSATLPGLLRVFTNEHGGVLRGQVNLGQGSDAIVNFGLIDGDVNLGEGDDHFVGGGASGGGTVTGLVSGGAGNDVLEGGSGHNYLQGNQGDDTIQSGLAGDWLVGGQGNDLISGLGDGTLLYGNLGNDTLMGFAGSQTIRGGQGDDSLSGGDGNDFISGDRGADTLSGGPGADIFHTFSGAGIDRVLDFNLAEGDRVQVDPGTAYTVSQVGADTVIDMGNGDQMILVGVQLSSLTGNWIFTA